MNSVLVAQTKWNELQKAINKKYADKDISDEERNLEFQKVAGYLSYVSPFVYKTETIIHKSDDNDVKIVFPSDYKINYPNGNRNAKFYIENHSVKPVEISRSDDTIKEMEILLFINGLWIPFKNQQITIGCGNGAFIQKLDPGMRNHVEISIYSMTEGDVNVPLKVSMMVDNKLVQSNEIIIQLFEKQIERLLGL
jgi:hypothetical protein